MKNLFSILLLFACVTCARADYNRYTVVFTNRTQVGDSNIINGTVSRWTNAPLNNSAWLTTNSITASATNLQRFIARNYPQYSASITNATNVLVSGADFTVAINGPFGYVTTNTASSTNWHALLLPWANQPFATNNTNDANELISGLNTYPNTALSTGAYAMRHFAARSNALLIGPTIQTPLVTNAAGTFLSSYATNWFFDTLTVTNFSSPGVGVLSFQVGSGSVSAGTNAVAVGVSSWASNMSAVAVGRRARAEVDYSSAFGPNTTASGTNSIAVGKAATAVLVSDIAIGNTAYAEGGSAIAIGYTATATNASSIALGASAATTDANQIRLGTSSEHVSIPGQLLISGSQSNTTFRGTNLWNGDVSYTPRANSGLADGYNSGIVLGTNVFVQLSGPSAAYTNVGFAAERTGSFHIIEMANPVSSIALLDESGLEGTAANRLDTGGATIVLTNNPAYIQVIYSGSRWKVINWTR